MPSTETGAADPWQAVQALLDQAVAAGTTPGAALCVRGAREEHRHCVAGQAELRPRARPVRVDTAWDLASLTKVLATTPLALALAAEGALDLDRPLRALLPDAPAQVTARHCLLHVSGLPAWQPLYAPILAQGRAWGSPDTCAAVLAAARQAPLQSAPGSRCLYSDLGFLLLQAALERAGGDRLDRLWQARVRAPAGVDLRWGWPGAAATEDCPVRGRVLAGEVHDLNAAVLGGLAGHAGLFGTAREVAALGAWQLRAWQGEVGPEAAPGVRAAWAEAGPGDRHLGWDGVSAQGSTAGRRWPADGVGHLGFTGTSLWLAPRQGVVVALCCNRVHPDVEGGSVPGLAPGPRTRAFRALRVAVHEAVVRALEAEGRWRD